MPFPVTWSPVPTFIQMVSSKRPPIRSKGTRNSMTDPAPTFAPVAVRASAPELRDSHTYRMVPLSSLPSPQATSR